MTHFTWEGTSGPVVIRYDNYIDIYKFDEMTKRAAEIIAGGDQAFHVGNCCRLKNAELGAITTTYTAV